jgi:hypothetical protein
LLQRRSSGRARLCDRTNPPRAHAPDYEPSSAEISYRHDYAFAVQVTERGELQHVARLGDLVGVLAHR